MKNCQVLLGAGNESANISKCHDEESNCLDVKEYEEAACPEHKIKAATKEEVESNKKFQHVNPNDIEHRQQQT